MIRLPFRFAAGLLLVASVAAGQAPAPPVTAAQQRQLDDADKLNKQVMELFRQGKFRDAVPIAKQALALREQALGVGHQDNGAYYNNLGLLLQTLGDNTAAKPYFERTLEINRKRLGEDHEIVAVGWTNLAVLQQTQGDYLTARRGLEQALRIFQKIKPESPETARALSNLGVLLTHIGDSRRAGIYFEQAVAMFRKTAGMESPETARALGNLGALQSDLGNPAGAQQSLEEALRIQLKTIGDKHPQTALLRSNLAGVLQSQGKREQAQELYQLALDGMIAAVGENHSDVSVLLNNLANVKFERGDKRGAEVDFERASEIRRKALGENHPLYAVSLVNRAVAHNDAGQAVEMLTRADAIARKGLGAEHVTVGDVQHHLGGAHRRLGNLAAARTHYEEALRIRSAALGDFNPKTEATLTSLGRVQIRQKDIAAASRSFARARRSTHDYITRQLPSMSDSDQIRFLESEYLTTFHVALSFGWVFRQEPGVRDASAEWLLNGKAVAQQALATRNLTLRDAQTPESAAQVEQLLLIRKQLAVLSLSPPEKGREQARATAVTQLTSAEQKLSQALAATGGGTQAAPWIELAAVRRALPAKGALVEIVRTYVYDFQEKVDALHWSDGRYLAWIIPPADAGEVEIVDLGAADAIDAAVEAARADLTSAAHADGAIATAGEENAERATRERLGTLTELIWTPLRTRLPDVTELVLSPDAALWLVPWSAMPTADDRYVIEDVALRYAVSGRDILPPRPSTLPLRKPLIFADPAFDLGSAEVQSISKAILPDYVSQDSGLLRGLSARAALTGVQRLPNTAIEAQSVAPSIKRLSEEPNLYLQKNSLESVAKRVRRPKLLMFATHGFFLPDQTTKPTEVLAGEGTRSAALVSPEGKPLENPLLRCGLLLAGCNQPQPTDDDGVLTGLEIVGLDLRGTELVVLSACETGVGKVRNGEGVAGLRQAFQLAGARAVVSTLWQVPDRDSALIMNDFFANMADGRTKGESLRSAQLKRLQARRERNGAAHPFFWAAWTITGD